MRRPTQLSVDEVVCFVSTYAMNSSKVGLCVCSALSMDGSASGSSLTHHMSETLPVLKAIDELQMFGDVIEFQYRFMSR